MKKILLIIALAFCIFQMVVLAGAIDIGSAAIIRNGNIQDYTIIDRTNPANDSGKITSVEIYAWPGQSLVNCEVATFYGSGVTYSTRDTETIGAVTAGAKRTFTVDLDVVAGDLIGIYYTGGYIYKTEDGSEVGLYKTEGDKIPCTSVTFDSYGAGSMAISLYGTGETAEEEEEVNVILFGTNF